MWVSDGFIMRHFRHLFLREALPHLLVQGSANFSCKSTDSKCFRFHFVSHVWSLSYTLLFVYNPSKM